MVTFIKKLKKNKFRLSGQFLTYCAVGLFVLVLAVALLHDRNTLAEKQQELDEILAMCAEQELENEALRELMMNSDDEYIERKAREEFDYVLPGERVYIIRSGN